jgi:hypothetical protein
MRYFSSAAVAPGVQDVGGPVGDQFLVLHLSPPSASA